MAQGSPMANGAPMVPKDATTSLSEPLQVRRLNQYYGGSHILRDVSFDIPAGKVISGSPGFDNRVWLRAVTIFQRLPELLKRLDRVEKKLAAQTPAEDDGSQE